jgi:predicted nucleic acid-binding protein
MVSMVAVIDSGTMITLSSTCLMNIFRSFIRENKIELVVSDAVADESVWRPISNKRFALNAARIKNAFNEELIKVIHSNSEIESLQNKILSIANNCFFSDRGPLTIIQRGEAEALALAKIYDAKALFVDERTTRSLIENPVRLKQVLEKRQSLTITSNKEKISEFRQLFPNLKIFRSVDIIAFAFEQNLFDHELDHGKLELEAALYAAKFAGCAVSEKEIIEYLSNKK